MSKKFAKINENNTVVDVVVADSKQWCIDNLGGTWIETNDDNFPSKGFIYDVDAQIFIDTPTLNKALVEEQYLICKQYQEDLTYEEYEASIKKYV
jgi:hypothetical protein